MDQVMLPWPVPECLPNCTCVPERGQEALTDTDVGVLSAVQEHVCTGTARSVTVPTLAAIVDDALESGVSRRRVAFLLSIPVRVLRHMQCTTVMGEAVLYTLQDVLQFLLDNGVCPMFGGLWFANCVFGWTKVKPRRYALRWRHAQGLGRCSDVNTPYEMLRMRQGERSRPLLHLLLAAGVWPFQDPANSTRQTQWRRWHGRCAGRVRWVRLSFPALPEMRI